MSKRKSRAALASDSDGGSDNSDNGDGHRVRARKKGRVEEDEDATSDSGDEWGTRGGNGNGVGRKKTLTKKASSPRVGLGGSRAESDASDDEQHDDDDDVDEGEITDDDSDSAPDSDESEEFNDGYDENLMGDEEDQARLAQMTEKEREQEIFNRIEKRERLKARFEIEKKLRQAKKKAESKAKEEQQQVENKALGTDVSMRSKERKKNLEGRQDKKSQAILNLRAEREKKRKAEVERKEKEDTEKESRRGEKERDKSECETGGALRKLKASDIYSDDDDSESGSASDSSGRAASPAGTSSPHKRGRSPKRRSRSKSRSESPHRHSRSGSRSSSASSARSSKSSRSSGSSSNSQSSRSTSRSRSASHSRSSGGSVSRSSSVASRRSEERVVFAKEHISQIRLSRFRLEQWLYAPFFTKTVIGCFVRVGFGQNAGESVYRVAEIMDVVETSKVYQLGKSRTNKGLRLKIGKDERVLRIEYVSNQNFTDAEFNKWMEVMNVDGVTLPTLSFVEKKRKDVEAANNHSYSVSDIQQIVEEKKKFKRNPHNYAMAKTEVMKKKEMAEQLGDQEQVKRWTEELERLEERAKELDKQRTSTISAIQYINERNRQKNIVDIERAILEEAKKCKERADDPFTRRKCAPSLVTKKTAAAAAVAAAKAAADANALIRQNMTTTQREAADKETERLRLQKEVDDETRRKAAEARSKLQREKQPLGTNGNDLFSAHDFDIAIELDSSIPSAPAAHQPTRSLLGGANVSLRVTAPRRSLNLEEYKKKRGLI